MNDPRVKKLSDLLLDYSLQIKRGETLYIEWKGSSTMPLIENLIAGCVARGATPFWVFHDERLLKGAMNGACDDQVKSYAKFHCELMDKMDCYLGINGSDNPFEMGKVPSKDVERFTKLYSHPVHTVRRIRKTRWCVLRWPSLSFAQMAQMPHSDFTDYFFNVCLVDYKKMSRKMNELAKLMKKTDRVRVVGDGTDLSLSIKGMPPVICDGKLNVPDGEVYTAPIKDSVNGTIKFNAPAIHRGQVFTGITATFKNGYAEKITCETGNEKELNKVFDIDEGARFIGEFAIGVNEKITRPMRDTLFDEKIDGSIHMAFGQSYDDAPNGNNSAIHWDLVHIQRPEFGGGEVYFDGKLVRKNGKFL